MALGMAEHYQQIKYLYLTFIYVSLSVFVYVCIYTNIYVCLCVHMIWNIHTMYIVFRYAYKIVFS